ncbi:hypothetical protein [Pseudonocardia sp.]|uniref:hypothetical protein n=1 Tax=Pseudonocardia sp. TaxID=60912 RepID=UPI003D0AF990
MTGGQPPGWFEGATTAEPLQRHECSRLRAAAAHARRVYPGPVGEVLARELVAYADFGYRGSDDALIPRLARQVLAMPSPPVVSSDAA